MANRARGTVTRIFTHSAGASIRLDVVEGPTPGGLHYFELPRAHANFNAIYSLILVVATNQREINVQAEADIDPNSRDSAVIDYVFVDDWT